jgi:Holliday junction DNA helicase RuvA
MYQITGKILRVNTDTVVIEANGVGYLGQNIFELNDGIVAQVGDTKTVYVLQYWNEFEFCLLFFEKEDLRNMFESLLKIKQIGIKTAKSIFLTYSVEEFTEIIRTYNVSELQNIKGLGSLTAKIIIDELNKVLFNAHMTRKQEKILQTLQRLGYKMSAIYRVLKMVDKKLAEEQMLSKTIQLLSTDVC